MTKERKIWYGKRFTYLDMIHDDEGFVQLKKQYDEELKREIIPLRAKDGFNAIKESEGWEKKTLEELRGDVK